MRLETLRFFCAVVEAGSFRGAAERIHRSQPAVSQQVKALEGEVGHLLLERKTCRPTPVGRRLYDRARHMLNEAESLVRELEDFDEAQTQELRVGTSDTTALYILPPVVRAFSRAMPQTRLVMVSSSTETIAERVFQGELDLGIVSLPVSREELVEQDLFEQKLVLVTPGGHPLGQRERVGLGDLRDEPMLLLEAQTHTGSLLWDFFRRESFSPQVVLHSGSFEVIKRYVGEGVGLAILPEVAVTEEDRSMATVSLSGVPSVRIGAIWRRHAYRTKAERAFLALIE